MKNVISTIEKYNLIQKGEIIGVACSGGRDSMSLLHFLNSQKDNLDIEVVAINIDHNLRETSKNDSLFVKSFCQKNNIKIYMYSLDVNNFCKDNNLTIEQGAREARYKVFKNLINKGIVNKIALAHHMQDQTETILLNIFRGASISGASGMEYIRDNIYIRPLLNTSRNEVMAYINNNEIPYVDDETNDKNDFSRNYIRNMIMPLIRNKWQNADYTIFNFGENCRQDDLYINTQIPTNYLTQENGVSKIYLNCFSYNNSIIFRMILKALKLIGITANIERKHLSMIKNMAIESQNGTKITLPNGLVVLKEYNYITFTNKNLKPKNKSWEFKKGILDVPNFGMINISLTRKLDYKNYTHLIDCNKLPKGVHFRYRKDGDVFHKFKGGTISLSDYLIDIKVPKRLRNFIPVLAKDNVVYVISGIEISDDVKVDKNTKSAYGINVAKF